MTQTDKKTNQSKHRLFFLKSFLQRWETHGRFAQFLTVGGSGLVVNNLILFVFTEWVGFHYLLSAVVATQMSTLWNFSLLELWVFGDRDANQSLVNRLLRYAIINNFMLLLRGPILTFFTSSLGMYYILSNVISILILAILRFLVSDNWIWKGKTKGAQTMRHLYDIHGIIGVNSAAKLPELEYFRTSKLERPDIQLEIGHTHDEPESEKLITYHDGLKDFGFKVTIRKGECTKVIASPLLRRSPHVLYTNIIEPLLRWTFVRKGYALLHGACLSVNNKATLITARTDTGKTTTILRVLGLYRYSFLSDDMTILRKDGKIWSYPKPLTISRHTLQAVQGGNLSFTEKTKLFFQSALHSRDGRKFGMMLAKMGLPAATLNAIVQMIIPPPKYMVDRLVPGVSYGANARLKHIVIIERGLEMKEKIKDHEMLSILIQNMEDAYGFPPYPLIANALSEWEGQDLHDAERAIISQAITGKNAIHLRDLHYGWWLKLPDVMDTTPRKNIRLASSTPS